MGRFNKARGAINPFQNSNLSASQSNSNQASTFNSAMNPNPYSNPNKPFQAPLSGSQKSNIRGQIVAAAGASTRLSSPGFQGNHFAPCTISVSLVDGYNITADEVIAAFTLSGGALHLLDKAFQQPSSQGTLAFDVSKRDALLLLDSGAEMSQGALTFRLTDYRAPSQAPHSLAPEYIEELQSLIHPQAFNEINLSCLPLYSEKMPFAFHNQPNYLSAICTTLATPSFVNITSLRLKHLCLVDLSPLHPLEPVLQTLDVSCNNLMNINAFNVLRSFTKIRSILLAGNPFSFIPGYQDSIRELNQMIMQVDEFEINPSATFATLPPKPFNETSSHTPENITEFLLRYITAFDGDRGFEVKEDLLSSAYRHDASFSISFMSRRTYASSSSNFIEGNFPPIHIKRNVSKLLHFLPSSVHDMNYLVPLDSVQLFNGMLLVQFKCACIWNQTYKTTYRRTFLLTDQAQAPWAYTIANDQIQLEVDETTYYAIFNESLTPQRGNYAASPSHQSPFGGPKTKKQKNIPNSDVMNVMNQYQQQNAQQGIPIQRKPNWNDNSNPQRQKKQRQRGGPQTGPNQPQQGNRNQQQFRPITPGQPGGGGGGNQQFRQNQPQGQGGSYRGPRRN